MSNLKHDYLIIYNPKNSKVIGANNIYFYTSDKNTCNVYIAIVGEYEGLELMVRVLPPNATTIDDVIEWEAIKHDDTPSEVILPNHIAGTYKYEIVAKVGNKLVTSELLKYTVRKSVLLE